MKWNRRKLRNEVDYGIGNTINKTRGLQQYNHEKKKKSKKK